MRSSAALQPATLQVWGASSANYLGSTQGPLLGDRTSITAITEQYAKADPIYVDKTMVSLPPSVPAVAKLAVLVITWQRCTNADGLSRLCPKHTHITGPSKETATVGGEVS